MAEELTIQGADVKIRHPWGAWALALVTLGIYGIVWWYKINRELRDYSAAKGQPLDNDPTGSVLALVPGFLIIVPPFWTNWGAGAPGWRPCSARSSCRYWCHPGTASGSAPPTSSPRPAITACPPSSRAIRRWRRRRW